MRISQTTALNQKISNIEDARIDAMVLIESMISSGRMRSRVLHDVAELFRSEEEYFTNRLREEGYGKMSRKVKFHGGPMDGKLIEIESNLSRYKVVEAPRGDLSKALTVLQVKVTYYEFYALHRENELEPQEEDWTVEP